MAPLTNWKDTHREGKKSENLIAERFGLSRPENVRATDLYQATSGVYCEVKCIGSKKISYVDKPGGRYPKYQIFQISKKAFYKSRRGIKPLLRPGGVFKTCIETPNSLFVVHCPAKPLQGIPERTYYYKAPDLMVKLLELLSAEIVTPYRYRVFGLSDNKSLTDDHGFETLIDVDFDLLEEIQLTEDEFRRALLSGVSTIRADVADACWQDAVFEHSIPCLKKLYGANIYRLFKTDPDVHYRRKITRIMSRLPTPQIIERTLSNP
jgi:hypothetical protein